MQAFARPDGAERTMAYSADARVWAPRPREPQPVPKKKAKSVAKPKEEKRGDSPKDDSPKKRRRRPATTEPDEKDENCEVVNVKPKDSELDAMEDDDQDEKAPHPQAESDEPRVADKQEDEETKEKAKGVVLRKLMTRQSKKGPMLCLVKRHLIPQWTEQHLRRSLARGLLMTHMLKPLMGLPQMRRS